MPKLFNITELECELFGVEAGFPIIWYRCLSRKQYKAISARKNQTGVALSENTQWQQVQNPAGRHWACPWLCFCVKDISEDAVLYYILTGKEYNLILGMYLRRE